MNGHPDLSAVCNQVFVDGIRIFRRSAVLSLCRAIAVVLPLSWLIACQGGGGDSSLELPILEDTGPPVLQLSTSIPAVSGDHTPELTFYSSKPGMILYQGSCSSETEQVTQGYNTITLHRLSDGNYEDCAFRVQDVDGNLSNEQTIEPFTIESRESVNITAWIGEQDSLVTFSQSGNGLQFIRHRDKDCELVNYSACDAGQSDVINGSTLVDDTLTLSHSAYLSLRSVSHNSEKRFVDASLTDWPGQIVPAELDIATTRISFVHDDRIWLFNNGDILSTADGVVWRTEAENTGVPDRYSHQVSYFNGRWWLIGMKRVSGEVRHSFWSSKDGSTWVEEAATPDFSPRHFHATFVRDGKLWLVGGADYFGSVFRNDIWSSSDGIHWHQELSEANFPVVAGHQIVEFNGRLWMIGGTDFEDFFHSPIHNVRSSADGIEWREENAPTAVGSRIGHRIIVYDNKLWVIGGEQRDVWSTEDGVNWVQENPELPFGAWMGPALHVLNNKLCLSGGQRYENRGAGELLYANPDTWCTVNGREWALIVSDHLQVPSSGHTIVKFNDKLLAYSDRILSSSDGTNWVSQGGRPIESYGQKVEFADQLWGFSYRGISVSDDGIAWSRVADMPEALNRWGNRIVGFNDKLLSIGGLSRTESEAESPAVGNDIWSSLDGITWVEERSNAEFSARNYHDVLEAKGRLWLIGGRGVDGILRDVWSSEDGVFWRLETASASALEGRGGYAMFAFEDKLWVAGGFSSTAKEGGIVLVNDIWKSDDGINWDSVTDAAGFEPRRGLSVRVFEKKIFVYGGNSLILDTHRLNDFWRSSDGLHWRRLYKSVIDFP